ncbi:ABC transporter ATP-binding protein [Pseudomonas chlororaphis]
MCSDNIAIQVKNISKQYEIYERSHDRLKQFLLPKMQRALGKSPAQYYKAFTALDDVSFDILKGETVGIIGRNGSGKSTLLQMICGTLNPTCGDIRTSGRIAALLELGSGFNPEFTGRENVYLNAAVLGLERKEVDRQFDEIASFAEIGQFMDQPIKTYSSGMVVRLAFAVQAHLRPDILIVDEALAVGDIFFQQKCIRYMREKLEACTKLLVTHDMQAIYNFCSRVIVLNKGKVIFNGDVKIGIETFMKINHGVSDVDVKIEASERLLSADTEKTERTSKKRLIPLDAMGGKQSVKFESFATIVNGKTVLSSSMTVFPGDDIVIDMDVVAAEAIEEVIVGYLIVDRNGMYVCGDNSLSVSNGFTIGSPGNVSASISFKWPAIANGTYTLTLGLGRGVDPMNHIVECWAHSLVAFESVSHTPVHGLFTNKLTNFECDGVER